MQIEYQITEDDFVSAGKLALRSRSKFAFYRQYILPAFGVMIILSTAVAAISRNQYQGLWPLLVWGSILLLLPLLTGFQYRRVYRKMPLLRDRRTLDIDDTTLHFVTVSSESRMTWQTYIKSAENDDTFILFQQGNQIFIPIPKRGLSPAQIDQLRTLFAAHLPHK